MLVEIRPDSSGYTGTRGHRIHIDGDKGQWHYGVSDRGTISMMTRHIQRNSKNGGKIIDYDVFGKKKPKEYIVEGCPTNHARVRDDFMGGSVCLDCKAVW